MKPTTNFYLFVFAMFALAFCAIAYGVGVMHGIAAAIPFEELDVDEPDE